MQMLAPGARANMAQRSLKEADEKEAKVMQQLDTAMEVTNLAIEAYRTNAESIISQYNDEEKTGWDDVEVAVNSFVMIV